MSSSSLKALERQIHHELGIMAWPGKEWVEPRVAEGDKRFFDVLIVGGGQCGLAVAYGLVREKVYNVVCLDENEASACRAAAVFLGGGGWRGVDRTGRGVQQASPFISRSWTG